MREEGNPLYNFLVDPDSMEGLYYRWRTYGKCSYLSYFIFLQQNKFKNGIRLVGLEKKIISNFCFHLLNFPSHLTI